MDPNLDAREIQKPDLAEDRAPRGGKENSREGEFGFHEREEERAWSRETSALVRATIPG